MGIEKMFEKGVEKRDAVDSIREEIRSRIDEVAKVAVNEKYKKDVKEEDEEDGEKDGEKEDDEDEELEEEEKTAYDRFFEKTLKLWKVDSPEELSDKEKKEFYDYIDKNWDSDKEEEISESDLNEAFDVTASRVGGRKGTDDFQINRMSDLKKLAKSRQYDYFMVTKKNGEEIEFSVDPQGNLVEM